MLRDLVLGLIIIFALSYGINKSLAQGLTYLVYRIVVFPGVLVHELSHALAALILGAEIRSINLFEKEGASLSHGQPRFLPTVSNALIALAPIFGGFTIIYLSSRYLIAQNFSAFGFSLSLDWFRESLINLLNFLKGIDLQNYKEVFGLYLILASLVTLSPSLTDFRSASLGLIGIGAILWLGGYINIAVFHTLPNIVWFDAFMLLALYLLIVVVNSLRGMLKLW